MKWLIIHFLFCSLLDISILSQSFTFQSLNGPYGGNLGDIVISSQNELFVTVYYNFDANGIYKSTDEGISWNKLFLNDFSWPIDYFGLGINDSDDLFVGTNGAGIYRSTDLGLTWSAINQGFTSSEGWVFAFDDIEHIYVGDGDHWGLFKSTNNGDSWRFLRKFGTLSIAIDSLNTVYVGTWDTLYKSTDDGVTWNALNNGLPSVPIGSILIKNDNEIFIGTGYLFYGNGVYYSSDGGYSWSQRGLLNEVVYSLAMHPSGIIFAGTMQNGVYRSKDNGQNWEQLNNGLINKNIYRLKMASSNILFASSESDGGIYKSTDLGDTWQNVGLPIATVESVVFDTDNNLYACTYGGVQKYNYSSQTWTNLGLPKLQYMILDDENYLFAGTSGNGVYKSSNFGKSWDTTSSLGESGNVILNMAKYTDGSVLLGTNNFIKRTTDKGISWSTIDNGLDHWVSNLSVSPEGYLYVITNVKLYRSKLIDSSFVMVKDSIEADYNNFILASGRGGRVYYVQAGSSGGVFRSIDYGDFWTRISDSSCYSISVFNDYVCVGLASGGVLLSPNQGDNWEIVSNGFPIGGQVYSSFFDSSGYLYCSIKFGGLYKSVYPVTSTKDVEFSPIMNFYLHQNYPNPFNPTTKISWQLPVSSWQTLKIYDILGNEVSTLVDEYKPAGRYDVEFDAKNLSSGVYFYQLKAGSFFETKKMILLR